jgi:flagellar FliL protein
VAADACAGARIEAAQMTAQAVADDGADVPEQEAPAPSRFGGKKKLFVFIGAPLLALLLIGAGLYFTGMLNKLLGHEKTEAAPAEEKAAPKQTVFFDLPDMLVNLNGNSKKTSFLKLSIALELENPLDVARLQSVMPRIIDNFQVYLRELRPEDLKGSPGMYRLREELLLRVNAAAAPAKVVGVLFKEMLVQ